jgi:hypothetical protein
MGVMVSKGFLIFAQNTESVDYVRQAYALALSIKLSQPTINNVSLVTNNVVPDTYKSIFDSIIEIPWGDQSNSSRFRAENRWKLYHCTPYDETIVLDSDMLLLEDISSWWNYCSNYDIKFCSRIKNHKLEPVIDTVYRKSFVENGLTNPYYALHYFKKTEAAYEFYKILEFVCTNWEWCYTKFAPNLYQDWLSMDLATAIAIEIYGQYEVSIDNCSPLEFIHMKPGIQNWDASFISWMNAVPYVLSNNIDLVVGNLRQTKLFHYVEDKFLTDSIITQLETSINGS